MRINDPQIAIQNPKRKANSRDHVLRGLNRARMGLPPTDLNTAIDPLGPYAFDPGPGHEHIIRETPEQRAFRRFPINSHKPA